MPIRRTSQLHGHRWSAPGVRYFVTACTRDRHRGLDAQPVTHAIIKNAMASDALGDSRTIALCVMPDHIHWLFELGQRLTLGRVIARMKAESRETLASACLAWQRDFFEHRLRAEDDAEDYARYVFLNPYRVGVVAAAAAWWGWWCPQPELLRFVAHLNPDGTPPPEWIGEAMPKNLVVGE